MIDSIFKILGAGLSLWEHKEKTKYIDKMIELKGEYNEEINKERPDNNVIDRIELELHTIGEIFSTNVAAK